MNKTFFNNSCAILLAAGKGSRMKAKVKNKVAYEVAGQPMITRAIDVLRKTGISTIIVVVGFAKDSVINLLDKNIIIVEQKKRLGTGHALKVALPKVPKHIDHVFVLNGDDSFLLSSKILSELYSHHVKNHLVATFLSLELTDPTGLGRIVRKNGKVTSIVEDKDATISQKKIKEVNAACYLFENKFAQKFVGKIQKSPVSGEYYIVNLIDLAAKAKLGVDAVKMKGFKWRGVNTPQELLEAEKIFVTHSR